MISTESIESLIPDFLMESRHFYLVVTDVDGRVLKFNQSFEKISSDPVDLSFSDFLSPNSSSEFNYSLELMLGAPKMRRHLMLEHPAIKAEGFSQVWWEFSVVTTPDMDISGIIGIGVGMQFLEQEMPWNNLVDVLGFGKIVLDKDLHVQKWDERILEWFDPEAESWENRALVEIPALKGSAQLKNVLEYISQESKPKCFLFKSNSSSLPFFAALLTPSLEGYHLFLVPKEIPKTTVSEKGLVPAHLLSAMPGAVFVLEKSGKLSQQNESAKNLGRIWKGRAYSEGYFLNFPNQQNRFSKLVRAIEEAKKGRSSDLELKMLMPDQEFSFWTAGLRPLAIEGEEQEGILIQVVDITALKSQLVQTNRENERLRDLALSPSHILRGPLSSMMGIIDLIDAKQLNKENQKLFSYLRPLTKELDQIIRQHAKKMSTFT
ncbi:hypothetical protein [Algoriphagus sp. A40]|uniref:hypothetical protein n=1 Tax=Algoriphagus sp. A40 TaxID=1945863 RepID=UPI00098574E5|nr:hypothetical protein [Algoriphagus sp. A40]OOG76422.1 hypothetical protein B0E43_07975 [Algoriphagus sp. A40]